MLKPRSFIEHGYTVDRRMESHIHLLVIGYMVSIETFPHLKFTVTSLASK